MNRLLYGDSENPNICYVLRNFRAVDPVLYLETSKGKFVFVSSLEINRAVTETDHNLQCVVMDHSLAEILKRHLSPRAKIIIEDDLPIGIAKLLERLGYRLVPSNYFKEQRKMKTQTEIAQIKAVSDFVAEGFNELKKQLKRRLLKDLDITSEYCRTFLENIYYQNGLLATHTIVAGGYQAAQPHNSGSGILPKDLPIVFDIFPKSRINGYYTDLSRTLFLSRPTLAYQTFYQDVLEAQQEAIRKLGPNKNYLSIEKQLRRKFALQGYSTVLTGEDPQGFIHSLGHGVGLEVHELPFCNNKLLKTGMVLTIEPGLYYTSGKLNHLGVVGGIRIEDTIVITDNGYEILTNLDYNPYL